MHICIYTHIPIKWLFSLEPLYAVQVLNGLICHFFSTDDICICRQPK